MPTQIEIEEKIEKTIQKIADELRIEIKEASAANAALNQYKKGDLLFIIDQLKQVRFQKWGVAETDEEYENNRGKIAVPLSYTFDFDTEKLEADLRKGIQDFFNLK